MGGTIVYWRKYQFLPNNFFISFLYPCVIRPQPRQPPSACEYYLVGGSLALPHYSHSPRPPDPSHGRSHCSEQRCQSWVCLSSRTGWGRNKMAWGLHTGRGTQPQCTTWGWCRGGSPGPWWSCSPPGRGCLHLEDWPRCCPTVPPHLFPHSGRNRSIQSQTRCWRWCTKNGENIYNNVSIY